jgi:hypothetical protein
MRVKGVLATRPSLSTGVATAYGPSSGGALASALIPHLRTFHAVGFAPGRSREPFFVSVHLNGVATQRQAAKPQEPKFTDFL